ncbi:FAD binding domain-containing protein [Bordetella genomosp. 11]|uniref:Molybdopterin dehydrogenase n=1 Tax=Bordetella genomosp. 11 TaxID=1416808 RepID=A0A261UZF4_9BORD|nr:FAD binding domain-containing protein [Bordetella genomosp. 11]OZI66732.1 molybdopterin dehydrogenase [Bordetella genomosp. 11]
MKPSVFTYHDPRTIDDAVGLVGRLENARPLAGGQSLMAMINMRFVQPDHIIDLNRVEGLAGIAESAEEISIGAMTRQRELEFSPLIAARLPLMSEALLHVGHRQTRNRGTLGGSLCHLDPAAEMVAVAAAFDAVVQVAGPNGRREIPFQEFPLGFMMPAIDADELVTGVRYPLWPQGHGSAFVEFSRRHGDFAIVSAAALVMLDGRGQVARAALALGGVGTAPLRMTEVESMLLGNVPSEALVRDAAERCRNIDALDDALVTAAYRRSLAAVMARRALVAACTRAGAHFPQTPTQA